MVGRRVGGGGGGASTLTQAACGEQGGIAPNGSNAARRRRCAPVAGPVLSLSHTHSRSLSLTHSLSHTHTLSLALSLSLSPSRSLSHSLSLSPLCHGPPRARPHRPHAARGRRAAAVGPEPEYGRGTGMGNGREGGGEPEVRPEAHPSPAHLNRAASRPRRAETAAIRARGALKPRGFAPAARGGRRVRRRARGTAPGAAWRRAPRHFRCRPTPPPVLTGHVSSFPPY